jgi:valyl-tRNA synthetase
MRELQYFVWHELADHYIELVKSRVYSGEDPGIYTTLETVGRSICRMLAPILPHVTEEVYQELYQKDGAASVHISGLPEPMPRKPDVRAVGGFAKEVTAAVRRWKSERGMSLNRSLAGVEILTEMEITETVAGDMKSALAAGELTIMQEDDTLHEEPRELKPVHSRIGPKFRGEAGEVLKLISAADPGSVSEALQGDGWELELPDGRKETLTSEDIVVESGWVSHGRAVETIASGDTVIVIREE